MMNSMNGTNYGMAYPAPQPKPSPAIPACPAPVSSPAPIGIPDFGVWAPPAMQSLPVGSYLAEFRGVAPFTLPQDGTLRWRWTWTISAGEHQGREASALTGTNLTGEVRNLIIGLLDRQPATGESLQPALASCVGKRYLVCQQPGPKGGKPSIRMVAPSPQ